MFPQNQYLPSNTECELILKNILFIFVYDVMTSDYYGSETGKNDAAIRKGKLASGTEEQYVKASVKTEVAVTSRIHGKS